MDGICFSLDKNTISKICKYKCILYCILYTRYKCAQSYTSVKTVLLRAIPTVIRTYYYDQYYGSDLSLLKITYLLPYIRVKLGVCQDISSLAQQ